MIHWDGNRRSSEKKKEKKNSRKPQINPVWTIIRFSDPLLKKPSGKPPIKPCVYHYYILRYDSLRWEHTITSQKKNKRKTKNKKTRIKSPKEISAWTNCMCRARKSAGLWVIGGQTLARSFTVWSRRFSSWKFSCETRSLLTSKSALSSTSWAVIHGGTVLITCCNWRHLWPQSEALYIIIIGSLWSQKTLSLLAAYNPRWHYWQLIIPGDIIGSLLSQKISSLLAAYNLRGQCYYWQLMIPEDNVIIGIL